MRSALVILAAVAVLSGCPSETSRTELADASSSDSGAPDATVAPIDAGPPVPAALEPTVTAQLADGGTAVVTAKAEIDPAIALTVTLPVVLKDFRIRLLDFREQIVPSDDALSADRKTYRIVPLKPLATGRAYSLVLDAELGPVVTDPAGGTWNDWELDFRVAGDVQPDPSEPGKKSRTKKKK